MLFDYAIVYDAGRQQSKISMGQGCSLLRVKLLLSVRLTVQGCRVLSPAGGCYQFQRHQSHLDQCAQLDGSSWI